jgi:hypothetical protein
MELRWPYLSGQVPVRLPSVANAFPSTPLLNLMVRPEIAHA